MGNPESNLVIKYQSAINNCFKATEPMREARYRMLEEYANGFYSKDVIKAKPLNLVFRTINTFLAFSVARNPKAMIRPATLDLAPFAETMRLNMNQRLEEIDLYKTLRQGMFDSFFYMGIFKSGITHGGAQVEDAKGYLHDLGKFFCEVVDGDDFFWDICAKNVETLEFSGNRYRLPLEYITDSGIFHNFDGVKAVYTEVGDTSKKLSPDKISKEVAQNLPQDEIRPYGEVIDVWRSKDGEIWTIPKDGEGTEPLLISKYDGPENGPYDILSHYNFPNSIVPIPPIWSWLDLHDMVNTVARSIYSKELRSKTVGVYDGTAVDDADAIRTAKDGEWVKVANVDKTKTIDIKGPSDGDFRNAAWLLDLFNRQAGNPEMLQGSAQAAGTLGQEKMMMSNASMMLEDMINNLYDTARCIIRRFAWSEWTDPVRSAVLYKERKGLGQIPVIFSKETRQGNFLDYGFDVEVYSMQRQTPESRFRSILQILQGIVTPYLPMYQAQGGTIDLPALIKIAARDRDLTESEVDEIFKMMGEPSMNQGNPFNPSPGVEPGQPDNRLGLDEGIMNAIQNETRSGGQSTPDQSEVGGQPKVE